MLGNSDGASTLEELQTAYEPRPPEHIFTSSQPDVVLTKLIRKVFWKINRTTTHYDVNTNTLHRQELLTKAHSKKQLQERQQTRTRCAIKGEDNDREFTLR